MFNIRNLVNRISQSREGEGSDASSTKSRSTSQNSAVFDEAVPVEAEGFLCPTCMAAFPSPEALQSHYESTHLEPGANYMCPICKARLKNALELEQHFSQNHSVIASNVKYNGESGLEGLRQELSDMNSTLNEERWRSEELRKEINLLQEMVKVQGTSEESQMYQQQLQGLQETKSLLTSEVVLLRKQLAEALESMVSLRQERDRFEEKVARNSQSVVQLQSSLDESLGYGAALQEEIRGLEAQLSQRATLDDAETLKKELAQVQRVMDETTREKEHQLCTLHEALKEEHGALKEQFAALQQSLENGNVELLRRLEQSEAAKLRLQDETEQLSRQLEELRRSLTEKSDQLTSLQRVRDETDVCVSQLRAEVTSLQEMLSSARHRAEGEVSAKESEMVRLKMDLMTQQQQATQLESRYQQLDKAKDDLLAELKARDKQIEEQGRAASDRDAKIGRLEETVGRMEKEKAELLVKIEQGDGVNAAVQQLQQDNSRLQSQVESGHVVTDQLERRLQEAADRAASVEAERDEWQRSESKRAAELAAALKSQSELQRVIDQSKVLIVQLEGKVTGLETQVEQLKTDIGEKAEQAEVQRHRMIELEADYVKVKEEAARRLADRESLAQQLAAAEQNEESLTKRIGQLESDAQRLAADHQRRNQSEREERDHLAASFQQEQLKVQETRQQLEKVSAALADAERQLESEHKSKETLERTLADKEDLVRLLEERIQQLEPLTEALEAEKRLRSRETAEWKDQEQMLRGEKESLTTLTTHLQSQVEELTAENRIQVQRFKNECEGLNKEKQQLADQLEAERAERSRERQNAAQEAGRLEEELRQVRHKVSAVEEELAVKYQRCQELESRCERLHSDKIEVETRLSLLEDECAQLRSQCGQWETEVERLKLNSIEIRRRLEDSQAALHELGRENQSLQMENAKLQGRKWADDSEVRDCLSCQKEFTLTVRKHHCRNCGQIFCADCSSRSAAVGSSKKPVRVCDPCFKELSSPR